MPVDRRAVRVVVVRDLHFHTEKITTAVTSEKIAIEITVANQYTAWIRSNSSEAEVGSH